MPAQTVFLHAMQIPEYQNRVLIISRPEDIAILREQPPDDYVDYLGEYGLGARQIFSTGVTSPEGLAHDVDRAPGFLERVRSAVAPGARLNTYYTSPLEEQVAQRLGIRLEGVSAETTQRLNDYQFFLSLCAEAKIPHPEAESVPASQAVAAAKNMLAKAGAKKIVLRTRHGAAGINKSVVDSAGDIPYIFQSFVDRQPAWVLLQPFYPVRDNIAVHFVIGETIQYLQTVRFGVSNLKFNGLLLTAAPGDKNAILARGYATDLARGLQKLGYTGVLGIDMMELENGELLVNEINARFCATTYAEMAIQSLLPGRSLENLAFCQNFLHTTPGISFARMLKSLPSSCLFDPARGSGLLLYLYSMERFQKGALLGVYVADEPAGARAGLLQAQQALQS